MCFYTVYAVKLFYAFLLSLVFLAYLVKENVTTYGVKYSIQKPRKMWFREIVTIPRRFQDFMVS